MEMVESDEKSRTDHDALFNPLKHTVLEEAMKSHHWDTKALDYLVG